MTQSTRDELLALAATTPHRTQTPRDVHLTIVVSDTTEDPHVVLAEVVRALVHRFPTIDARLDPDPL